MTFASPVPGEAIAWAHPRLTIFGFAFLGTLFIVDP
jgi:hypothetical protein